MNYLSDNIMQAMKYMSLELRGMARSVFLKTEFTSIESIKSHGKGCNPHGMTLKFLM